MGLSLGLIVRVEHPRALWHTCRRVLRAKQHNLAHWVYSMTEQLMHEVQESLHYPLQS